MASFADKTTYGLLGLVFILYAISFQKEASIPLATAGKAGGLFLNILPKMLLGF